MEDLNSYLSKMKLMYRPPGGGLYASDRLPEHRRRAIKEVRGWHSW